MLGSKNNANSTLLVLKPVSRDKDKKPVKPFFEISKKVDEKWEILEDKTVSVVKGNLFKIEAKEEEYEGEKYFRVKVCLRDNDEIYLIPFRLNIASRSLLNSLLSLTSFEDVSISFYRSKSGYETFFVSQNEEKVPWKYEISDLPKAEEVKFKNKIVRDYTQVDKFFVEAVTELSEKLSKINNSVDKKEIKETVTEQVTEDEEVSF